MSDPKSQPERIFSPPAALLAWMWPGLGHISLGDRPRGFRIMAGMLFLIVTGLLVGGVDCVDRRNDPIWFWAAQSLCGPIVFAVDLAREQLIPAPEPNWQGDMDLQRRVLADDPAIMRRLDRTGVGHVNEFGTLFVALAGLMNFAVMLDALHHKPRASARRRRAGEGAA